MTPAEKRIFNQCDALVSKLARGQPCQVCGMPAAHAHHIVRRGHLLLRHEPNNIAPLCARCHENEHNGRGVLAVPEVFQRTGLTRMTMKEHCRKNGKTTLEFLTECRDNLRSILERRGTI
jgi:hypothetical protein